MKRAYIVKLVDGDGDTLIKLVDQETWNWISLEESGQPQKRKVKNFIGFTKEQDVSRWDDGLCPQSIRDRIEKQYLENENDHFDGVWISAGAWDNDRAILAPILEDNEEDYSTNYATTKAIMKIIKKAEDAGYDVDMDHEYQGVMY